MAADIHGIKQSLQFLQMVEYVHLFHEDPEALLWITLNKNKEAVSYRTIRTMIKSAAEK